MEACNKVIIFIFIYMSYQIQLTIMLWLVTNALISTLL